MKTRLLVALFLFLGLSVYSQSFSSYGKRVAVGITVGPSIDWITPKTDGYESGGTRAGFRYGIPVDINFTSDENYYFTTGVQFSHIGGKLNFPDKIVEDGIAKEVDMERKYGSIFLNIPTGIKLKTPSFGNFVFAGNFGLYHGFSLSSKSKDSYIEKGKTSVTTEKKKEYKETMFFRESIYVGLGVEYIIKDNFKANVFINYSYTFTNYFNKKAENNLLIVDDKYARERGNLSCVEFIFGFFF